MDGARVTIEGLDRVAAAITRLANPAVYDAAMRTIGEQVRARIARYPGPPKYPLRWASRKQAFYVKNVLRKSLGPYVRRFDPMSQNLGQSWAVAQEGRRVFVGTKVTYAPYVQSAARQQPFHADTGWITDEKAVREVVESGVIHDILRDALRRALGR